MRSMMCGCHQSTGATTRLLLILATITGISKATSAEDAAEVQRILGVSIADGLLGQTRALRAVRLLAEQTQGIDYASLGIGWHHPNARTVYRQRQHKSFTDSRSQARTEASHRQLKELVASGHVTGAALTAAFVREIGLAADSPAAKVAQFGAVLEALEAELLLPLRAYQEHGGNAYHTKPGAPIPPGPVDNIISEITLHVLQGDFSAWRYSNPMGKRQLEGLSDAQIASWMEPARTEADSDKVVVHEGSVGELDFFWATKIGGPSHGFDYEPQCLFPLLANARHKALLISDPRFPAHPAGRAHLRLLWTQQNKPVLWLEAVNVDYVASRTVDAGAWQRLVLRHVVSRAVDVGGGVSVEPQLAELVAAVAAEIGLGGVVNHVHEPVILRPSAGVTEASDYLGPWHDWVQMEEQASGPHHRALYFPVSAGAAEL